MKAIQAAALAALGLALAASAHAQGQKNDAYWTSKDGKIITRGARSRSATAARCQS